MFLLHCIKHHFTNQSTKRENTPIGITGFLLYLTGWILFVTIVTQN
ncbi:hypothetical protein CLONEX_03132 [[Clostridium] nexile DSM 1787]|nr:hypothetical protein CLONEX_03132 [[Clostridium] nexile DSM 1787]